MARSTYIYLLRDEEDIVRAFTVKWELRHWAGKNIPEEDITKWWVIRLRDGMGAGNSEWTKYTLAEVLHGPDKLRSA